MKLSIIVSMYKVEKYVEKCIVSLLDQDLPQEDFEIIIINDGSPDNSRDIVQQLITKYRNIRFIEQDNQGLARSRNSGIEMSKGKYILFVDPDDYIEKDTLSKIVNKADELNCDMLYLNMTGVNENYNIFYNYLPCGNDSVVSEGVAHPRRPFPATLYNRSAIGTIRHIPEIRRAQDSVFNAMVQSQCKRVSYYSLPYYYYLHRNDSCKINDHTNLVFESCLLAITSLNKFYTFNCPEPNRQQQLFFENIIKIFIERTLQWSILPSLNKNRFRRMQKLINILNLKFLLDDLETDYKYINQHYIVFYTFHKIHRIKKFLINK